MGLLGGGGCYDNGSVHQGFAVSATLCGCYMHCDSWGLALRLAPPLYLGTPYSLA